MTTDNILHTQFARNQRLVRLINKFPNPPNKDVGEGLNTAFDAMRKLRLKEPDITETESSVLVVIPHQKLASPEEIVMEFLAANPEISNKHARSLCGIRSENSMKSVFKHWKGFVAVLARTLAPREDSNLQPCDPKTLTCFCSVDRSYQRRLFGTVVCSACRAVTPKRRGQRNVIRGRFIEGGSC